MDAHLGGLRQRRDPAEDVDIRARIFGRTFAWIAIFSLVGIAVPLARANSEVAATGLTKNIAALVTVCHHNSHADITSVDCFKPTRSMAKERILHSN